MTRTRYAIKDIFIPDEGEPGDGSILISIINSALDRGIEAEIQVDITVRAKQLQRLSKAAEAIEAAMQVMGVSP